MRQMLRVILFICPAALMLMGCGDSDTDKAARAAQFTTSVKPAPNPQREQLQDLVRKDYDATPGLPGAPKYELYSEYKGEDIRQVTGVSGRSLLLFFSAPWCKHSDAMRRALQELAEQEKGGIQVVEVNADTFPVLAEEFSITKVPTVILYTEGVKLRTLEGSRTASELRDFMRKVLTQSNK
ncbi:MAG: thioredoxin family protein [Akkermansia sp.]|nr:thioredoxin family protein [Akkermansia sp.]